MSRQGHRLIQVGVALLLFTSFEGFAIPHVGAPRLGLSVHTLSAFLAVLFTVLGLVWPRLHLSSRAAAIAFWCLLYSGVASDLAYTLAALWGAGNSTMPFAAGPAHGSRVQELVIRVIAYSSAPTGIAAFAIVLWGLRLGGEGSRTPN